MGGIEIVEGESRGRSGHGKAEPGERGQVLSPGPCRIGVRQQTDADRATTGPGATRWASQVRLTAESLTIRAGLSRWT